jgi:DNA polymerase/3'-5' exonuclease PolX
VKLAVASNYAAKLKDWLSPFCERIEIAGSVRRGRDWCNDIDLVCIPKLVEKRDLLGAVEETRNLAWEEIVRLVFGEKAQVIAGGKEPGKYIQVKLLKSGVQLDVFFAEMENFASRFLCRTGSKEHNIWLAERAQLRGGKWEPYNGLTLGGALIPATTEADIYRALGVEYIEPANREEAWIKKYLEFGL